jgi:hypothetical protein
MKAALRDHAALSEVFMAYLLTRNSRIEEDLNRDALKALRPREPAAPSTTKWLQQRLPQWS